MGQNSKTRLYIAKINYSSEDRDLQEFFSQYGTVKEAKVITDRDTGKSRGFGFVEMNTSEEANRALAADGEELDGRKIGVSFAREREQR